MPSRRSLIFAAVFTTSACMANASATPLETYPGVTAGEARAAVESPVAPDTPLLATSYISDPLGSRGAVEGTGLAGLVAAVPEPAIAALMAVGFAGIGWITRRRHRDEGALPSPTDPGVGAASVEPPASNAGPRPVVDRPA